MKCKDLVGRVVRLKDDMKTVDGQQFVAGELCIVRTTYRGRFNLTRTANRGGDIRRVHKSFFEVLDPDDGPFCVRCGCSDNDPCEGGCFWDEDPAKPMDDVCSQCVGKKGGA